MHRLANNQVICDVCLDWHEHTLEFLAGGIPRGCQECGKSWDEIQAAEPGAQVRMYVVPKDGIYQLLCVRCVGPYCKKRPDVYRETEFGRKTLKI